MPRVIVKCRYYQASSSLRDIGGMLRYIALRKGVDRSDDSWETEAVSKAQEDIILRFTDAHPHLKKTVEHRDYVGAKTKGTASEFISMVLENFPELLSDKTYLDYIATRPRVEKIEGAHGLFSDEDVALDLPTETDRMRNHNGNVFTVIVSLKRDDAERLGYNCAEHWRDLLRSKIDLVAKAHNIPASKLRWYGAFHNESHHPHIHLMLYSDDPCYTGHIDKKGIEQLHHLFGTEIFRDDLKHIYDYQTKYRKLINASASDEIDELVEKIRTNPMMNNAFTERFIALAKCLQTVSGKKVYGYLPKAIRQQVCELVDELEQDEDIARMYELWYQAKCALYNTYTDNTPVKKLLSQEEAFKPIRNALIKEANALGAQLNAMDEENPVGEEDATTQPTDSTVHRAAPEASPPHTHTISGAKQTTIRSGFVATSVVRFANSLSRTFRNNFYDQVDKFSVSVDSRLQREIEAKKKGQNLSL